MHLHKFLSLLQTLDKDWDENDESTIHIEWTDQAGRLRIDEVQTVELVELDNGTVDVILKARNPLLPTVVSHRRNADR